ncbi:hypothetical protein C8J57DRAFT_1361965 [Mycena rebaudengoi]|nr:hypothetical protein C8J57DRAFT_1364418 [Mycena rebaudengoi]KAJ7245457.1 hypothetical protein C8J57DRAFT_1361965 [Mycena rebaudengoi]
METSGLGVVTVLAIVIRVRVCVLRLGVAAALFSSPRLCSPAVCSTKGRGAPGADAHSGHYGVDRGIGVSGRWCWSHSFHLPFVPPLLLPPSSPFLLPAPPPHLHASPLMVST